MISVPVHAALGLKNVALFANQSTRLDSKKSTLG